MNSTTETTPAAPGTTPLFVAYDAKIHTPGFYYAQMKLIEGEAFMVHVNHWPDGRHVVWMCATTHPQNTDRFLFGPRIPSPEQLTAADAKGAALDALERLAVSSSIYFQPGCNNVGVVMFLRGGKNGTEYDTAAAAILAAADRAGAGSAGEG